MSESVSIGLGHFFTQSIACCIDSTSQIQNPATNSLVSVNGPSVTARSLPEKRTRAPCEVGFKPASFEHDPRFDEFLIVVAHRGEKFRRWHGACLGIVRCFDENHDFHD